MEENNQVEGNQEVQPTETTPPVVQQSTAAEARVINQNQQPIPNSTGALVLGIISIATCWCYGIIGITLGIIGLVLANKGKRLYEENPDAYTEGSYKNLNAGRITSIIGLSLSAAYILFIIVYIFIIGAAVMGSAAPFLNF